MCLQRAGTDLDENCREANDNFSFSAHHSVGRAGNDGREDTSGSKALDDSWGLLARARTAHDRTARRAHASAALLANDGERGGSGEHCGDCEVENERARGGEAMRR